MSKIYRKVAEKLFSPPLAFARIDSVFLTSPIMISSGSSSEKDGTETTPIRQIACLKNADDLKRFEETEDCFILDFLPENLICRFDYDDDNEISLVAEKGQAVVACKEYPHSRHLCLKFPFETTSHGSHCIMCYCYVCDSPAPCSKWKDPAEAHCHATDEIYSWMIMRTMHRGITRPN